MKEKTRKNPLLGKVWDSKFCLLASICTAFIMFVVFYCYDLAPFGDITILRMDLYHQYGPLYAELYDRITTGESLLYSWNSGGGSSFLGNFYNYLASPTAIFMLLFGHENMPEAISAMILTKAVLASFTFAYFIQSKFNIKNPLVSSFGVLYACSGFFIAYYWNIMWIDAFYLFPLVMLGIERIISQGKMKLYTITLALTLITNYYMGYMVCIFSVLYFIYRYFSEYSITATLYGKLKKPEKTIKSNLIYITDSLRNSRFFSSGAKFAFCSVGAALLSAFALLPVYFILMNCSATSGTFPQEFKTYFSIFDFLANHLAYLAPTIRSSGTDVLPNVYCGVLTVMLVPLYIFSNKVSAKEKVMSIGLMAVMFASFYTNYLNYIWHGFHFPNDLPYRFSYMYSFVLLILAFKALTFIKEYTNRQIIGVGTATIFFIILVQEIGSKNFSETGVWICVAFIGIYCLALGILKNPKYPYMAAAALILCSTCAEYTVANTNNYSMDQPKVNFAGDYEDFRAIKGKLDAYNGNDDYRMELTSLRARMDPCWYDYNGVSTFTSMAYEKASNMQYHLGMFSNYINSYTYNRQTAVYNAFFALDYIVDNKVGEKPEMSNELYTKVDSISKYTAYENNYSLPLAFRVNNEIEYWSHDNPNPFEVQSGLFQSATGINDVFNALQLEYPPSSDDGGAEVTDLFAQDDGYFPYTITNSASASLTFRYAAIEDGNAYIYIRGFNNDIPYVLVTYDSGIVVRENVDSKPHIIDLGELKEGEGVDIYVPFTSGKDGYLYLFANSLNRDSFYKGYDALKADSLNITSFEETEITGDINVSEDGILYTSINYDTGWSVYIDGEKVQQEDIVPIGNESLLGVRITEGEHTVTFKYVPQGLVIGCIISATALIMMILLCIIFKTGIFKFKPVLEKDHVAEDAASEEDESFVDITELVTEEELDELLNELKADSSSQKDAEE